MNFKRKNSQISFYLFYLRHKSKNLNKSARSFQVGVHFDLGHSQSDTFLNSFCAIERWTILVLHMRFLAHTYSDTYAFFLLFKMMLKIGDTL